MHLEDTDFTPIDLLTFDRIVIRPRRKPIRQRVKAKFKKLFGKSNIQEKSKQTSTTDLPFFAFYGEYHNDSAPSHSSKVLIQNTKKDAKKLYPHVAKIEPILKPRVSIPNSKVNIRQVNALPIVPELPHEKNNPNQALPDDSFRPRSCTSPCDPRLDPGPVSVPAPLKQNDIKTPQRRGSTEKKSGKTKSYEYKARIEWNEDTSQTGRYLKYLAPSPRRKFKTTAPTGTQKVLQKSAVTIPNIRTKPITVPKIKIKPIDDNVPQNTGAEINQKVIAANETGQDADATYLCKLDTDGMQHMWDRVIERRLSTPNA